MLKRVPGSIQTVVRRVKRLLAASLDLLKRSYHFFCNLPHRILHRSRHNTVLRTLARVPQPRAILVVCHGNICRSPYLQAVLQRSLPAITIESAGFFGSDRPVPEVSLVVSAERGFNLSRFRSRPITTAAVAAADLIIVMSPEQARYLARLFNVPARKILIAGDLDPALAETRAIADPWQQPIDAFRSAFDRLDRCGVTVTTAIRQAR